METVIATKTKEILHHHLDAFVAANVDEILKDYDTDSELLTPQGVVHGLDAIRSFFKEAFKLMPKGSSFELKQEIIFGNVAYIVWVGSSSSVNIPIGTDTFIMEKNKIRHQTLAAHIVAK